MMISERSRSLHGAIVRAGTLLLMLAGVVLFAGPAWSQAVFVNPPSLPSGMQGSFYNQPILANEIEVL